MANVIRNKQLPVYLLSDSQLLFWCKDNGQYFLQDELKKYGAVINTAVYIGAANNDMEDFFDLFQSAMEIIGCMHCHFLKKETSLDEATRCLQQADLVLLAGGDVKSGWQFIKPLKKVLTHCYSQGTMLMGISAGAMHLSALAWPDKRMLCRSDLYSTMGLVPCVVSVHDEENNWHQLKQVMAWTEGCFSGLGIPFGAGLIVDNGCIIACRKPVVRLEYDGGFSQSFLVVNKQSCFTSGYLVEPDITSV